MKLFSRKVKRKMVVDFQLQIEDRDYEAIHYECPKCGARLAEEQMVCSCGVKFDK